MTMNDNFHGDVVTVTLNMDFNDLDLLLCFYGAQALRVQSTAAYKKLQFLGLF